MKKVVSIAPWAVLLSLSILVSACSRSATSPGGLPIVPTPQLGQVLVSSVKVTDVSIEVTGTARLPEGGCIQTALYQDGSPVDWWPADVCIEPDNAPWQMVVALGQNGAPATLDSGRQYEIRAWWPEKAEESQARFPFQPGIP